jgi:predicted O-methyltransferase YrrM
MTITPINPYPYAAQVAEVTCLDKPQRAYAVLRSAFQEIAALSRQADSALAALWAGTPNALGELDALAQSKVPRWHFAMLNDQERNAAFATALERQMPSDAHVLDIGSGTGVLAMMAVEAGAAHVTTCEASPVLADIAQRVITAHRMTGKVTVLPCMSTSLRVGRELARPADLIVSEIVDCGLVGEGFLPTIRHAREQLLAPEGILIPRRARIKGCLVAGDALTDLNRVHQAGGFDVRAINTLATVGHFPVRLSTWPHRIMSPATPLANFNLEARSPHDGSNTVVITADQAGQVDGLVAWFDLDLGAGVSLQNSPNNVASHWMQALMLFEHPIHVELGGAVTISLTWRGSRLFAAPAAELTP